MKKFLASLLAAVSVFMIFTACGKTEDSSAAGKEIFKGISAIDLNNSPADETIFKGKRLTMVNIWATFCGPCINEMPDLEKLSKDYASKGFQIVGIVCDVQNENDSERIAEAQKIVKDTGVTYRSLISSPSLNEAKLNTVYSVPETIFLDESGKQIGESYIGSRSYNSWKAVVDELLADLEA